MLRLVSALFVLLACRTPNGEGLSKEPYRCTTAPRRTELSQNALTATFRDSVVQRLASGSVPDAAGAIGRNRAGYFHVRFQNGISALTDYAVDSRRTELLDMVVRSVAYSFQQQTAAGDFTLVIPGSLANLPPPTEGDLASGVAFFAAALGPALLALDESAWYQSATNAAYKTQIENARPAVQRLLAWMLAKESLLRTYDAAAPNRLLFDALAFYSLGRWLNNAAAKAVGLRFAEAALANRHPDGYFLEGGGWDSSYQGVALSVGLKLFSLLEPTEPLRNALWQGLSCGADWQYSRLLPSGEISTEKNTRVYPGGEQFLGQEKQMAWTNTLAAFYAMAAYTGDARYLQAAERLIRFYG